MQSSQRVEDKRGRSLGCIIGWNTTLSCNQRKQERRGGGKKCKKSFLLETELFQAALFLIGERNTGRSHFINSGFEVAKPLIFISSRPEIERKPFRLLRKATSEGTQLWIKQSPGGAEYRCTGWDLSREAALTAVPSVGSFT